MQYSENENKNAREDEINDSSRTIKALEEELQQIESTLSDRAMSQSLTRAVITDSAFLTQEVVKEDAIATDRAIAERFGSGEEPARAVQGTRADTTLDELLVARLTALYIPDLDGEKTFRGANEDDSTSVELSQWATPPTSTSRPVYECISCGEQRHDSEVFQTLCTHYHCQQCLNTLFELSTRDETLFPPRCCRQVISVTSIRLYLDANLVQRFEEKSIEFTTPNRVYCSRPTCSAFIPPANITTTTSTATCSVCFAATCTICRGNTHNGNCPEDVEIQLTLDTAQEQGWQRCHECGAMIELDIGCYHITYAS